MRLKLLTVYRRQKSSLKVVNSTSRDITVTVPTKEYFIEDTKKKKEKKSKN